MAEINLTERCEMACEILQATNGSDDLDPMDKSIQRSVNPICS